MQDIEKIRTQVKFYIKDNKILFESTTYNNNNNIIISSRIGNAFNITNNSYQIILSGSTTFTAGIIENTLVTGTKEETSGTIKYSTTNDKYVSNTKIVLFQ